MSKFFLDDTIVIEAYENFQKQSFRNRCEILSANGKLSLFVPVIKGKDQKTPIREVEIDYTTNWQKQHLKSIESAYNASPFFEFIFDDFSFVFNKKEKFLFDLNLKILDQLKEYLQFENANGQIQLSQSYLKKANLDYRNSIHPKKKMQKEDSLFVPKTYYQTFNDRFNFKPNLSILDLLFNEGPQAPSILKRCRIIKTPSFDN